MLKGGKVWILLPLILVSVSGCARQASPASQAPTAYLGQKVPGTTPTAFAPEAILEELHSGPVFSPDGTEVYWSTMRETPAFHTVLNYMKVEKDAWTKPTVPAFSTGDDSATFSPDGKKVYFLRRDGEEEDIYYVEKVNDGWSTAVALPDAVNSLKMHWTISVASNGDLYFSAHAVDEPNDIYRAELVDGQYLKVSKLEDTVNSEVQELCPFIARDGSYLLFARVQSNQSYSDLYVSFKGKDGSWGKAIKFPSPIDSKYHELSPCVSDDGKYLFFLSFRGGSSRPYWVDAKVIEDLRPQ